jgi:pimeloyl-ACP methyl ester carboxylesterase
MTGSPRFSRWEGSTRAIVLLPLLVGVAPESHGQSGATAPHRECFVAGIAEPMRCITVTVWEDRSARAGRRLPLRVIVLPRLDSTGSPRAYFVVTGGPGQGAATTARAAVAASQGLRRTHDIVLVDQRGTGESGSLRCPMPRHDSEFFGAIFPRAALRACRDSLRARADLAKYGTADAMDDLDEVRAALGYDQIDLEGQSYGSLAARVYARRHPSRVRSLVLIGVVPDQFRLPSRYAASLQASLDAVLADCERDAGCARAHPRLREHLTSVVTRLRQAPVPTRVRSPGSGETFEVRLSLGDFAYGIRGLLYHEGVLRVPELIDRAAAGHFTPVAQAYLNRATTHWRTLSIGMHLAVACTEDVPYVTERDRASARATIAGTYLIDEYRGACRELMPGVARREPESGRLPDVPILLLSGRRDPVTPPYHATRVAADFRDRLHLVFSKGGHGYWGGTPEACVDGIRERFVALGTTRGLDVSCARQAVAAPTGRTYD